VTTPPDTGTESHHEAAHAAYDFEIGLFILEIRMTPTTEYSAAVATEDRKKWVLAAQETDRRARAENMIRMLMAGNVMDKALGSTDPFVNQRALGDEAAMNYFRRTYIPEPEWDKVMTRLRAEVTARITEVGSPMRQAIDALAAQLKSIGHATLPGDDVRKTLKRFLTPPNEPS
jgi:hypothetical protein